MNDPIIQVLYLNETVLSKETPGCSGGSERVIHSGTSAADCPSTLQILPRGSPPLGAGLTFVERCLSGLVGNVRLGPSLEQRLEAVQVSPARGQVKGRFLLQGALVDDGRVCWGEQMGSSRGGKIPPPPQHKDNPNFHKRRV